MREAIQETNVSKTEGGTPLLRSLIISEIHELDRTRLENSFEFSHEAPVSF